jgi:hypothetical protein
MMCAEGVQRTKSHNSSFLLLLETWRGANPDHSYNFYRESGKGYTPYPHRADVLVMIPKDVLHHPHPFSCILGSA